MAESKLSLGYNDFLAETGLFAGFGRGAVFGEPAFTTAQQNALDSAVKSGLRMTYYPPELAPGMAQHDWSFLKPVYPLDLPRGKSGQIQSVQLPDDFGGIDGRFTILSTSQVTWWAIPVINPGQIRERYSITPLASGRPLAVAVEWQKSTGPQQGQRANLLVYPPADIEYTLQVTYYIMPDYLTGATPYAYGPSWLAETILAACKYAWERDFDNMGNGPMKMYFFERLAAAIGMDRKSKPQELGYNGDQSDWKHRETESWRPDQHGWSLVTYKGTQY